MADVGNVEEMNLIWRCGPYTGEEGSRVHPPQRAAPAGRRVACPGQGLLRSTGCTGRACAQLMD